jgi:4'-phosphopantetheinyl transferase
VLPQKNLQRPISVQTLNSENAVDLWLISYENPGKSTQNYREFLAPDELERAARFKFDHLRDFYVFCRGSLRLILSHYLNTHAASITFDYGEKGKPYLSDEPNLQFNASHSGELFVCAVTTCGTIGVDVEKIHPVADMDAIAKHFFAPSEQHHLAGVTAKYRTEAFYECWTRKEAIIKATGEGVSRPLDSFEVAFGPNTKAQLMRIDDDTSPSWQIQSFQPRPGYIGAIASPQPWQSLQIHEDICK